MSSASKRPCLRDNFAVCEGSQNGTVEVGDDKNQALNVKYFAVRKDARQVEMRVQHGGKNIGRFTHRIGPTEKLRWVKANFLVELITHYGGRKRTKGGREFHDMNLRSLGEVFQELPEFPETLVSFLKEYAPAKKTKPVPQVYKQFILQTWEKYKDKVLSLYAKRVQPTTSAHVVLDSGTDEMEIGEREAQLHERNKTCTNHDTISKDIEEHIDKCLSAVRPISREDANSVLPEIRDVEEENHLAPLRTDETEFGEREAEFSRQTMSPHSEVVENGDLLQRFNNRIMELEKIIADLQAQVTRFNSRVVELEKILADLQAQRSTASRSVVPPNTREDDHRVSPEVSDWLAYFEYDEYNNQTCNST